MLSLYSTRSFEPYRDAFVSVQRAQLDGLKVFQQLTRFHFTLVGDVLYHNLAGMQALVRAGTPAEYFQQQEGLNVHFAEQVHAHQQQFVDGASEILSNVPVSEASAPAATVENTAQAVEDMADTAEDIADEPVEAAQQYETNVAETTLTPQQAEDIMKQDALSEDEDVVVSPTPRRTRPTPKRSRR